MPAWAWLAVLVLVSFLFRAWVARGMLAPFIMVDELIYSELAKSFADSGRFLVRDVPTTGYGLLYPVVISPAYALFDSIPQAYGAVKTINALVMSLAGIPAFLLARRVLPASWSLLAAVLALALPSLLYTTTVMTENLFYPLFLLAAWALLRVLERPTWWGTVGLYAVVVAAAATRIQAVAIVAAILTAPPLFVLAQRRSLRELRAYLPLYAIAAGAVVLAVAAEAARGKSPRALLGAYAVVGDQSYDVGQVLHFWLWHLEELDLYVGVAPVAAAARDARARPLAAAAGAGAALASRSRSSSGSRSSSPPSPRSSRPTACRSGTCSTSHRCSSWCCSSGRASGAPRPLVAHGRRRGDRRAAPARLPVRTLHRDRGDLRHARAAPDLDRLRPPPPRLDRVERRSRGRRDVCGLLARPGPLRDRRPARRPPLLRARRRGRSGKGRTASSRRGPGRSSRASAARSGTGSTRRSRRARASRSCGRATRDRFTINQNEFFNRALGPVYYTGAADTGRAARDTGADPAGRRCRRETGRDAGDRPLRASRRDDRARRHPSRARTRSSASRSGG